MRVNLYNTYWVVFFTCAFQRLFYPPSACMLQVSGMRIYTSEEVEAVNGTDVRLRCTFESSSPIKPDDVVITWTFRPLKGGPRQSVFYYQRKPFPPQEGLFRKRISWAGDIMGSDASIIIREVKFTYNGTYICQVKNPPDVHGPDGEIKLRVSQILVLHSNSFSVCPDFNSGVWIWCLSLSVVQCVHADTGCEPCIMCLFISSLQEYYNIFFFVLFHVFAAIINCCVYSLQSVTVCVYVVTAKCRFV
uniref:Myelin protein zero like 2 n=1 Tax=Oreochromis niloticus TaxID=8128 RepID=A0A669AZY6_ORENI